MEYWNIGFRLPHFEKSHDSCNYSGRNPLICPNSNCPLMLVDISFGNWSQLQPVFVIAGKDPAIPYSLFTARIIAVWYSFKRIRCQCTLCGQILRIPRRRILRFERFFEIEKGQPFVWQCHDSQEGVVIPYSYKNIHGEIVKIYPENLDPNTKVMRF